jgi:hypothetical protein
VNTHLRTRSISTWRLDGAITNPAVVSIAPLVGLSLVVCTNGSPLGALSYTATRWSGPLLQASPRTCFSQCFSCNCT